TAEQAAAVVAAARYPAAGRRSYGPTRAMLRIGPTPAETDESVLVLAMIETAEGLANVDEICATPGLDGVYVGPSDLCLAVGGRFPGDPAADAALEEAIERVRTAAHRAGIAAGIHNPTGERAARRLAEGFTFVTVASDLTHLEHAAAAHLKAARTG
uniref:aldolase/citrate lyase family protein n=1 Tax=Nonomuraea lactucae TaxID=2249762 RepID=UPI001F062FD8